MDSAHISLGAIGAWEFVMILGIILLSATTIAGMIALAVWFHRRRGGTRTADYAMRSAEFTACPRCGRALPPDAPQGLCPRCVLHVGLGTKDAGPPAFRDASGKPNPPDPGELAASFRQLEIIELLGQGGMGAVYKARQRDLDRVVALKILPGGPGGDPAFAERFTREARALARLSHPNIVAVHEFGQVEGGADSQPGWSDGSGSADRNRGRKAVPLYYFIMEFIDGPNLRQLMHGQKLSPQEALSIVPKICEALQFAHDEGIVHRDIKPENILLDTKGRVKIADFGIAKILGKGRYATLTRAKDVIGTPHYMAPEQVEHPTEVDHRADIYSLGVVFYEMLTGELPLGKFSAPSHKVQVDVRLDEVVLHALEKEPARRYQHANEVKTDVETITSTSPRGSGRESSPTETQKSGSRLTSAAPNQVSRFSRLAIIGACWAPLFFLTTLMYFSGQAVVLPEGGAPRGPAWWQMGLSFTLLPLGLAAPFGTTICGAVALSQIRRSGGKLCGLGLALFDALLFPLLALDGFIVCLVYLLLCQSLGWVGFNPGTEVAIETALLPAALIIVVFNGWLVRWAWRSAKRMSGRVPTPAEQVSAATWMRTAVPVSALLLIGAAVPMVVTPLQAQRRAERLRSQQQERIEQVKNRADEEPERAATAAAASIATRVRVPPVVLSTLPESGSANVDPALTELRVTFSKPMQNGHWSWVQLDAETYPETTGQPRFTDDGLTCVLPVKLKPGKTYATWINVDNFQNFRDQDGNAAVPYLLVFKTKGPQP